MEATTSNPGKNAGTQTEAPPPKLVCPECGNSHRFIQVREEDTHLVDGNLNYIRLLEGIVDHYICWQCGVSIEFDENEPT